jgi:hypothetical protein
MGIRQIGIGGVRLAGIEPPVYPDGGGHSALATGLLAGVHAPEERAQWGHEIQGLVCCTHASVSLMATQNDTGIPKLRACSIQHASFVRAGPGSNSLNRIAPRNPSPDGA